MQASPLEAGPATARLVEFERQTSPVSWLTDPAVGKFCDRKWFGECFPEGLLDTMQRAGLSIRSLHESGLRGSPHRGA